ncbi:MAG: hypothetical protein Q9214_004201 [Letrouitia sp. 1 TL-2023]
MFRPRDVDIVREQVEQGKFKYLDQYEAYVPPSKMFSATSSDLSDTAKPDIKSNRDLADDERPIYPPSVANTGTSYNPRSQTGSDGTEYTGHRLSLEQPHRPSLDRPRPSFDRMRDSMDRIRASFEASNDFTSAALLTRLHPDVRNRNQILEATLLSRNAIKKPIKHFDVDANKLASTKDHHPQTE